MLSNVGRVVGIDVARCLALLGMMATHILPGLADGRVPVVQQIAGGRSAALFAVLAGISLVLVAAPAGARSRPVRGRALTGMAAGTAVRTAVIALIGLLLGELDSGIAVILVYYAVLFVVAVPFLALRTAALAVVAAVWAVLAPVASLYLRDGTPLTSYQVPSFDSLLAPDDLVRELLLTGYYPVLTWVPYLMVGIIIGRLDLRSARTASGLMLAGATGAVLAWVVSNALLARPGARGALIRSFEGAGWLGDLDTTLAHGLYGVTPTGSAWWLAVRAPHTGTTLDLLMTAGSACVVVGICLLLGRLAPRLLAVVFGAGAMTLTLYSLHVLARQEGWWDGDDVATYLGQVVSVLAIGAAFRLAGQRGPLERLTGDLSQGARRAVMAAGAANRSGPAA